MAVNKGDLTSLLQYRRGQARSQESENSLSSPRQNNQSSSSPQLDSDSIKPTSTNNSSIDSTPPPAADNSSPAKVGRPPGRRSNPDTENTTLILNKKLKAEVIYKLSLENLERAPGHKTSLSDLVEQLLFNWNESQ